jgi:pimeloyl-ACP methyl ester carboxylesterase
MKLLFAHGKESGPWGFKIKRMAPLAERHGCEVESIDYRDCTNVDARVERLLQRLPADALNYILVGSSMGGYVSLVASAAKPVRGLFLIAPALCVPSYKVQQYPSQAAHIEIVHGWGDEVIPAQNSIDYARDADCALHLISGDHALNGSIGEVETLFQRFLARVTSPR